MLAGKKTLRKNGDIMDGPVNLFLKEYGMIFAKSGLTISLFNNLIIKPAKIASKLA
jgi:hypothetical protein